MDTNKKYFCRRLFREYLCEQKGIDRDYLISLLSNVDLKGLRPEFIVDKWLSGVVVTMYQNPCVLKLYQEMVSRGICEEALLINDGCVWTLEVCKLLRDTRYNKISWDFDGIELFRSNRQEGKEFYLYKDACYNLIKSTKYDDTVITDSYSQFLSEESQELCNEFIQWCCKGIYEIISPQFLKYGKQYEYSGFSV